MVGGSGLLVVVAEVHLHRDLPTAEVLGELSIDFVPIDLPVEIGTVGDVEFVCIAAPIALHRLAVARRGSPRRAPRASGHLQDHSGWPRLGRSLS